MGDASGRPDQNRDALIGKLALELHWVTPLQLREALSEQWADVEQGRGKSRSLGSILVARGILTGNQLDQLYEQIQDAVPAFPPFGKYNLVREIGRGGGGVVYEAEDAELKRRVALKILATPAVPETANEIDRFLRDSRAPRSLPPHPGIVPVLEADVIDSRRYAASELVDGVSMGAWHKHGSVTVRQRVALLRDVALALHHAHRHGIVHRGLKPENILVDRNHQPRITDLGLAQGAPAYLSPEQQRGEEADARSDQYALGVMLYEILTGQRPAAGMPVVPPSKISNLTINPVLYRNLENICLIALSRNPKDRYPDAETFARDLTKWLKGEDVRIVLPKSWRILRAGNVVRLALAGLLLVAIAAGGTFYLRSRDAAPASGGGAAAPITPVRTPTLQPGCIAEYYAGMHFNALGLRKIDNRATFDDPSLPLWREGPGSYTSRRWMGYLRIASAGTYVFDIKSKEQARLVIGEVERYNGRKPATLPIPLEVGVHRFLLEHAHAGPEDTVSIAWQKEGDAAPARLGPGALSHAPHEFTPVEPQPSHRKVLGPVPGAEEGEMLQILEDSGRRPGRKAYGPFAAFWKGSWSGAEHLFWNPRVGDRLKLRFAAGETGRGTLALGLTSASDHGIFRVRVNAAVVVERLDQYAGALLTQEVEFHNVRLKAGANELEFEVVGSNPDAREWAPGNGLHKLGLDYVLVR